MEDYVSIYANAFNTGRKMARDKTVQSALSSYDADPEASVNALVKAGAWEEANALTQYGDRARQRKTRASVGQMLGSGDSKGARTAAMQAGDFDMVAAIDKMSESQRAQATDNAMTLGAIAIRLQYVPYEERKAALANAKPFLAQRGFTGEQLDGFDPTDANLNAIIASATDFKTALEQSKPVALGKDQTLVDPQSGKPIAWGAGIEQAPGGGGGQGAPATFSPPTGGMYDQVAQWAGALGADEQEQAYLRQLARVESGGDPNARNKSSTGVFQFHPDTFAGVGGRNINDPQDQTKAALNLARKDAQALQGMGMTPSPDLLYVMHQQGAAGGRALLSAPPEVSAVAALTPAYGGNANMARQAVVGNGGSPDMSAGEFVNQVRNYYLSGKFGNTSAPGGQGGGQPAGGRPQLRLRSEEPDWTPTGDGYLKNRNGDIKADPRSSSATPGVRRLTAEEVQAEGLDPAGVYQKDKDGRISTVDKVTAEERKLAGFANRAVLAKQRLDALADKGIVKPSAQILVSERNGVARFIARNPKDAQLVQAMNEWVIPLLRRDTGAAVTTSELQYYADTYLPQLSDDAETLASKAAAREDLTNGMVAEAGRTYSTLYGDRPKAKEKPPVKGAQKGADGWHIEDPAQRGSFPRLEPIGDGRWKFWSAKKKQWGIVQ